MLSNDLSCFNLSEFFISKRISLSILFLFIFCKRFFSCLSFFIDLPPGTFVTENINFTFRYSELATYNLFNGIFFSGIITLFIFLFKKKSKPISDYNYKKSKIDYELRTLLNNDQINEIPSDLTEIKGIGPKRAIELELAGVKTISDLAKRSPQHLAEKTGIPITQISEWIIKANKLKK